MVEPQSLDASVERLLSVLLGHAVARTVVKQAHGRGAHLLVGGDATSARAFVRGPLLDVLSPLVGRGEAARLAHKVERSLAEERSWPIPEEDTLTGGRRSNPGGGPTGANER